MEKLEQYQNIILDIISFYGKLQPEGDEYIKIEEIIDKENKRFILLAIGWNNKKRVHDCIMHIDIIDSKVWIQEDTTDLPVIEVLQEKGILKEDIVLGFEEIM